MTLSSLDVYAANILNTVRQPLLLLTADLRAGEWRDPHLREPEHAERIFLPEA